MKINRFDVVELNDTNRATILDNKNDGYFVEVVSPYGISLGNKIIYNDDIAKVIYSKEDRSR